MKKLKEDAIVPKYQSNGASGIDLCAIEDMVVLPVGSDFEVIIANLDAKIGFADIGTGLAIEIPEGYEGQIRPRSGLSKNHGVGILNAPGTIDSDYRGEIRVILYNISTESFHVHKGDRIAQLIISKVEQVSIREADKLSNTDRGEKGFGSTGL